MSVLRNVAKVIILGVGSWFSGIHKDFVDIINSQCYVVKKQVDTDFFDYLRRLELLLWVCGWVDIWSDVNSIFFSETSSCRRRQPHIKGMCRSAYCSLTCYTDPK
jgi:hypothetical protein